MAKFTPEEFIQALKEMKVKEVMAIIEAIKEEFGVDPSAVFAATSSRNQDDNPEQKKKNEVNVRIVSAGQKKIEIIKAVKELAGLGLMESKKLVDSVPVLFKEGISTEEAEKIREVLVAAGAEVAIEE